MTLPAQPEFSNRSIDLLGRLLATENILIRRAPARTASFNLKDRVLTLPNWEGVSKTILDLFVSHEVSHALYTPPDGWVDAVHLNQDKRGFKAVLNILEDIRIEKKIQRKYPGFKTSYFEGYHELVERGFFGLDRKFFPMLRFLDRLNIYAKYGIRSGVSFTPHERPLVARAFETERWDEVLDLAYEVWDFVNQNGQQLEDEEEEEEGDLPREGEGQGEADGEGEEEEGKGKDDGEGEEEEGKGKDDGEGEEGEEGEGEEGGADGEEIDEVLKKLAEELGGDFDLKRDSLTQEALEQAMASQVKDGIADELHEWPKLNPKDFILTWRELYGTTTDLWREKYKERREEEYRKFTGAHTTMVNHMAQQFELKKRARQVKRATESRTGRINPDRIWRYKFSDDIFLNNIVVPDGKNHGLLVSVDMSSSMANKMAATIHQIILLGMFCQKIRIPFRVLGFADNLTYDKNPDAAGRISALPEMERPYISSRIKTRNDPSPRAIQIPGDTYFRELLTSEMGLRDFREAVKDLLMYAAIFGISYSNRSSHEWIGIFDHPFWVLTGTPLQESMFVLRHVESEFKELHRVEHLTTMLITDGEGKYMKWGHESTRPTIRDRSTGISIQYKKYVFNNLQSQVIAGYELVTGSPVIRMLLVDSTSNAANAYQQISSNGVVARWRGRFSMTVSFVPKVKEEWDERGMLVLPPDHCTRYLLVDSGFLNLEPNHEEASGKSHAAIRKAFIKKALSKQSTKLLVNELIRAIT